MSSIAQHDSTQAVKFHEGPELHFPGGTIQVQRFVVGRPYPHNFFEKHDKMKKLRSAYGRRLQRVSVLVTPATSGRTEHSNSRSSDLFGGCRMETDDESLGSNDLGT